MKIFVEKPKKSTTKFPEVINNFSNLINYFCRVQDHTKLAVFLQASIEEVKTN